MLADRTAASPESYILPILGLERPTPITRYLHSRCPSSLGLASSPGSLNHPGNTAPYVLVMKEESLHTEYRRF